MDFTENDAGKSFKVDLSYDGKEYRTFAGVFISTFSIMNDVPRPNNPWMLGFFVKGKNREPIVMYLRNCKYKNIRPTRLPKEVGELGRSRTALINKALKNHYTRLAQVQQVIKKLRVTKRKADCIACKFTTGNTFNDVKRFLREYIPFLLVVSCTEDYDGREREEYGIEDIEETRHLALHLIVYGSLGEVVLQEYFDFVAFAFARNVFETIEFYYGVFDREVYKNIEYIIRCIAKENKLLETKTV